MAGLVEGLIEQQLLNVAKALENQLDEQMAKLDNMDGDDIDKLRARRMAEMRRHQEKTKEWLARGHGEYRELQNEKEFFSEMKGEERMVCHFYRENWPCKARPPVCSRRRRPPRPPPPAFDRPRPRAAPPAARAPMAGDAGRADPPPRRRRRAARRAAGGARAGRPRAGRRPGR